MTIMPNEYDLIEACWLSGQIEPHEFIAMLDGDEDFRAYHEARMSERGTL